MSKLKTLVPYILLFGVVIFVCVAISKCNKNAKAETEINDVTDSLNDIILDTIPADSIK